jgi:hypothetical protein
MDPRTHGTSLAPVDAFVEMAGRRTVGPAHLSALATLVRLKGSPAADINQIMPVVYVQSCRCADRL